MKRYVDEPKHINEIGMAIPLLDRCDIAGDALLTQRTPASYIVDQ